MGRMSTSEILLISVSHNITLVGKVWLILMVLLRVGVLLLAGYPLYQDEQERFVCNTIQPGCANVCYDLFAPVSLFRFWLVQLTALCLPYVTFIIYVVHKVSSGLDLDTSDPPGSGPLYKIRQESFRKKILRNAVPLKADQRFNGVYILQLLFRILLEAGFGAAHYYLFGFYIPRRFLCQQNPCTTQVDCYISRPTEKTVMLNFMLGTAALSLLLNVVDLFCAIKRSLRQRCRRKMLVENLYEEEHYFLSPAGGTGVDATLPLSQDQGEPGGSFRKRPASKCSSTVGGGSVGARLDLPLPPHGTLSPGPTSSTPLGTSDFPPPLEEGPEAGGSEVALCPPPPTRSPLLIRVSKRGRLKPPPPPRRDLAPPPGPGPLDASAAVRTRRMGQYTLVELMSGGELGPSEEGQDKRSEWV
ncbi:gap junction delta-4 protein [Hypomesus transpacificus]|uniref:gap junction delta-4 protein n=1 Tax=Hypomesus transpacificus TaxID=137520 RepID=UPI001F07AAE2|nr:gap junction delta-4 protein [Hypomesus transpacificus]